MVTWLSEHRILERNPLTSEDVGTICSALDFVLFSQHGENRTFAGRASVGLVQI